MMNNRHSETEFLRQCIRYDDTGERHRLEERIARILRDERCVRRAVWLMALFAALAVAGLCYSSVLLADHPGDMPRFATPLVSKILCALGLGSLICLLAFVGLGAVYRKELERRREECRQLTMKTFESRLGNPAVTALRNP